MTPVQQHLTFLCSVPSSWSVSLQMRLYILCTCGSKRLAWDHTFYAIAAVNNWKIVRILKNAHDKSKLWKWSVLSDQHNQKCHYFTFKQSIKVPMSRIWKFPTPAYWHTCIENCKSPPVFFFYNLLVANKNRPKRETRLLCFLQCWEATISSQWLHDPQKSTIAQDCTSFKHYLMKHKNFIVIYHKIYRPMSCSVHNLLSPCEFIITYWLFLS